MSRKPIAAIIKASCIDGRERIAESSLRVITHAFYLIQQGVIQGSEAEKILGVYEREGPGEAQRLIRFFRTASGGGGWSESGGRDLETVNENGYPILFNISARHNTCGALAVKTHLTDPDVAMMYVIDHAFLGMKLRPLFRAHLETASLHLVFERQPMDLEALVAWGLIKGNGRRFSQRYEAEQAQQYLGLPRDQDALVEIANRVKLDEKGLLVPSPDLY